VVRNVDKKEQNQQEFEEAVPLGSGIRLKKNSALERHFLFFTVGKQGS
jgi:hypothetical protein